MTADVPAPSPSRETELLTEVKALALGGSLVDLAIGVAIGVAFAGVVLALADDLIAPIPGAVLGENSFERLYVTINHAQFRYGDSWSSLSASFYWRWHLFILGH